MTNPPYTSAESSKARFNEFGTSVKTPITYVRCGAAESRRKESVDEQDKTLLGALENPSSILSVTLHEKDKDAVQDNRSKNKASTSDEGFEEHH